MDFKGVSILDGFWRDFLSIFASPIYYNENGMVYRCDNVRVNNEPVLLLSIFGVIFQDPYKCLPWED